VSRRRADVGSVIRGAALVMLLAFCSDARGEGREVIFVREGPRMSKFVYVHGQMRSQESWSADGRREPPGPGPLEGLASHYGGGDPFTGSKTANGETLVDAACTAAHRTLPIGTWARVTNQTNGRSVVVRINDRGPFFRDRVIDLSQAAARIIGIDQCGLAPVRIEPLPSSK
jgi:rare lipoprotein A